MNHLLNPWVVGGGTRHPRLDVHVHLTKALGNVLPNDGNTQNMGKNQGVRLMQGIKPEWEKNSDASCHLKKNKSLFIFPGIPGPTPKPMWRAPAGAPPGTTTVMTPVGDNLVPVHNEFLPVCCRMSHR